MAWWHCVWPALLESNDKVNVGKVGSTSRSRLLLPAHVKDRITLATKNKTLRLRLLLLLPKHGHHALLQYA